jgi:hypothetical protein
MALTKTVELENSFGETSEFANAYLRVDRVDGTKYQVSAKVDFHKNKEGRLLLAKYFQFSPNLEGGNFIQQAYEHLKTLPEFEGAIDC